jgi:hypothetical protein
LIAHREMEPGSAPATCGERGRLQGWRRELLGLVLSVAVVLVAYHPIVVQGRTFDDSTVVAGVNGSKPPPRVARPQVTDLIRPDPAAGAWQTVAWGHVVHAELAQGHWPFWNPDEGTGEPLLGNAQSAALDPLLMPFFLHPSTGWWDLCLLLSFALGAMAMYLLLRRLGAGLPAAVLGSAAFTLGGWFAMDTSDAFVHLYAYLPLLFLLVDLVRSSENVWWVAGLAAAIAGCLYAGMPEASFFVLVAAGSYGVFRCLRGRDRRRAAIRMAGGAVIGLALAAPYLLNFAQFLRLSVNAHPAGVGMGTGARSALLNWLMPFVNGYPRQPRLPIAQDRGWVGMGVGALAAVSVAAPKPLRRAGGWFFLVMATVVLTKNHDIPPAVWLGRLPGFDRADSTAFAPPVATFGLAVAAALGLQGLLSGCLHRRRLAAVLAVSTLVLGLLLLANHALLALKPDVAAVRTYLLAGLVGAAVVAGAVVSVSRVATVQARRLAAFGVAGVVLAELLALFPYSIYAPRADPYQAPSWLALIRPAGPGQPAPRVFGIDELLYPNTAGALGLEDPRTLNGLYVARYVTFIRDFVSPSFTDRFTGDGIPLGQIVSNPMFDLLGVRYVLDDTRPLPGGAAGSTQYTLVGTGKDGVQVWENQQALPRAFVASHVVTVPTMAAAVSYLRAQGHPMADGTTRVGAFDPARTAVVESATPATNSPPAHGTAVRPARIVEYSADRVTVMLPPGPSGVLVLTDAYYPGWAATVNGRPAPVMPTDVAFRGVAVGSGVTRVVFRYRAPEGSLEWLLPAAGLALLLAWSAIRRVRRRGLRRSPDGGGSRLQLWRDQPVALCPSSSSGPAARSSGRSAGANHRT